MTFNVRTGSMLLKNTRHLVFNSDSIPAVVVTQAAPYDVIPRSPPASFSTASVKLGHSAWP
jgi:hypothetical protein